MSIAVLKRKSNSQVGTMSANRAQFSLQGGYRNQGWVGQSMTSRHFSGGANRGGQLSQENHNVVKKCVVNSHSALTEEEQSRASCDNAIAPPPRQSALTSYELYNAQLRIDACGRTCACTDTATAAAIESSSPTSTTCRCLSMTTSGRSRLFPHTSKYLNHVHKNTAGRRIRQQDYQQYLQCR